eukprot:TRINITY_DN1084_c0_g1_i3.p1 TRINITY_DN1084_c0_g1~~TRINITY_DN1084_c0_g1_i3.p1  ORF type:complete len:162 (-),score=32.89 TRINITY_DN1084_c0_g1_i3:47-532(-)
MCRLALRDSDWLDVCPWGYSSGYHTAHTIEKQLKKQFPDVQWLVRQMYGADVVLRSCAYSRPDTDWIVLGRPGSSRELRDIMARADNEEKPVTDDGYPICKTKMLLLPGETEDVSSTQVRSALQDGDSDTLRALLPEGVAEYLLEKVRPQWRQHSVTNLPV